MRQQNTFTLETEIEIDIEVSNRSGEPVEFSVEGWGSDIKISLEEGAEEIDTMICNTLPETYDALTVDVDVTDGSIVYVDGGDLINALSMAGVKIGAPTKVVIRNQEAPASVEVIEIDALLGDDAHIELNALIAHPLIMEKIEAARTEGYREAMQEVARFVGDKWLDGSPLNAPQMPEEGQSTAITPTTEAERNAQ